ncbi:hypothetical protein ACJBSE_10285, partial [Streptococcus suis]
LDYFSFPPREFLFLTKFIFGENKNPTSKASAKSNAVTKKAICKSLTSQTLFEKVLGFCPNKFWRLYTQTRCLPEIKIKYF